MTNEGLAIKLIDWFWQLLGALRGRPRIHVQIQEDKPDQEVGGLRFEIENRRWTVTSLDRKITLRYHYQDKTGTHVAHNAYYVRDEDRRLEPFRPRILTASVDRRSNQWWLSFFRTYTFRPTSGLKCRVRVRHLADLENLSFLRSVWEYAQYRWSGKFRAEGPENYGDYQREKRARGPH